MERGLTAWMSVMILSSFSSTSSRVHERRIEFCDISRPETATVSTHAEEDVDAAAAVVLGATHATHG